jgi:DNA-binding XRE family transcriptional regulator
VGFHAEFARSGPLFHDAVMYEKATYKAFEAAFKREFRRRLVAARKDMGIEQEEMADRLGCSRVSYPKYETRSQLPLTLLPALIAVTDKPYSYWSVGMPAPPGAKYERSADLRIAR